MKGWIALDIDGTITDELYSLPEEVSSYFHSLHERGWRFVFITGRMFSLAFRALDSLDFPFLLAVQNGADILQMPDRKLLFRNYLPSSTIPLLEDVYSRAQEDFIIYAGYDHRDFCYYRPHRFSSELIPQLDKLKSLSSEPWKAVDSFSFTEGHTFPLIKCLGKERAMRDVHEALKNQEGISTTFIRDPLSKGFFFNLVTHEEANKGSTLKNVLSLFGNQEVVIAAGDDRNDISMLDVADIAIVMGSAPLEMHSQADILAKPASENGIIEALEKAISDAG
ncbi:MAG: HAD family phosphatase [Chlamydiales bacterium]|nr:HAD family phosphatase [Chlamydiales bacterium]